MLKIFVTIGYSCGWGTVIDIAKLLSLKKFDYVEQLFEDSSRVVRDKN